MLFAFCKVIKVSCNKKDAKTKGGGESRKISNWNSNIYNFTKNAELL